jgi:hypothetical protein
MIEGQRANAGVSGGRNLELARRSHEIFGKRTWLNNFLCILEPIYRCGKAEAKWSIW